MKNVIRALAALAVIVVGLVPAMAQSFLSVAEDVPLAPNLTEVVGEALTFQTPSGRISEAVATGAAKAADVQSFYRATLPQLGWQAEGNATFARDGERLTITPELKGGLVVVRFTLSSQ